MDQPKRPDSFRSMLLADFAKEFSQLDYKAMGSYLYALGEELYKQAAELKKQGKADIGSYVHDASLTLARTNRSLRGAWGLTTDD